MSATTTLIIDGKYSLPLRLLHLWRGSQLPNRLNGRHEPRGTMDMEEKRILFVLWAANLGGVQSSIMTRIRALRRLGVKSEVLLYYSGAGKETFAGVTTCVTNKVRTFAALVKQRENSMRFHSST